VSSIVVANEPSAPGAQLDLIQRVRSSLETDGMYVSSTQLLEENRRVVEDHLLMVVQFLGVMGWVMIIVGGMALSSTMSLAVLERTREIGVMRAIGAGHGAILRMIQAEGFVIALIGWLVALPLSVPISGALAYAFSRIMLPVPVRWVPESSGLLQWLAVVVVVSLVSCTWPAIRAMRVSVRTALAYE
jgi:putative ABC transport system permease protein